MGQLANREVERVKQALRRKFGDHHVEYSEVRGSTVFIRLTTGREVTESMIEADFHQEYWQPETRYEVEVSLDGDVIILDEETA